jgi:hypothetical protein
MLKPFLIFEEVVDFADMVLSSSVRRGVQGKKCDSKGASLDGQYLGRRCYFSDRLVLSEARMGTGSNAANNPRQINTPL